MTIKLLAIGKTDDPALQDLTEMYIKRLLFIYKFEIELSPILKRLRTWMKISKNKKKVNCYWQNSQLQIM